MATLIYIIHASLYMPVVLYSATLSLSELTGISLVICISLIGSICVFYTLLVSLPSENLRNKSELHLCWLLQL